MGTEPVRFDKGTLVQVRAISVLAVRVRQQIKIQARWTWIVIGLRNFLSPLTVLFGYIPGLELLNDWHDLEIHPDLLLAPAFRGSSFSQINFFGFALRRE
jgi:hypothetical protein